MPRTEFRFGVNLFGSGSAPEFLEQVRGVADAGADVVLVPDHLGFTAPFPALTAAAAAAPDLRVGHFVLNAGFYRPALLAREVATVDQLTGGRLEVGLGAGYAEAEFEAAGLEFPSAGRRVDHLDETVRHLRAALTDGTHVPAPVQSPPPLMVAGIGNRVLTLAARHADIVAFSSAPTLDALRERVDFVREKAGDRFADLELNLIVYDIALDREPAIDRVRGNHPDATDAELRASLNIWGGSLSEVADRARLLRDELGISYFVFIEPSPESLADIGRLVGALR